MTNLQLCFALEQAFLGFNPTYITLTPVIKHTCNIAASQLFRPRNHNPLNIIARVVWINASV